MSKRTIVEDGFLYKDLIAGRNEFSQHLNSERARMSLSVSEGLPQLNRMKSSRMEGLDGEA